MRTELVNEFLVLLDWLVVHRLGHSLEAARESELDEWLRPVPPALLAALLESVHLGWRQGWRQTGVRKRGGVT